MALDQPKFWIPHHYTRLFQPNIRLFFPMAFPCRNLPTGLLQCNMQAEASLDKGRLFCNYEPLLCQSKKAIWTAAQLWVPMLVEIHLKLCYSGGHAPLTISLVRTFPLPFGYFLWQSSPHPHSTNLFKITEPPIKWPFTKYMAEYILEYKFEGMAF